MIPIRQAMLMELRLNTGRFGAAVALCVLCLVLAATVTDALVAVLPIWAVLAWYRYGRADTASRAELRASLGLSRADRVRGRVALIGFETLLLLLTAALAPFAATATGRAISVEPGPTFTLQGPPDLPQAVLVGVGLAMSALVLVITAIVVGGDCLTHRPARSMAVLSFVVYLGAGMLCSAVIGVPLVAFERAEMSLGAYLLVGVGVLVLLAAALLVLRRRVRRWIRVLDSGAAARAHAAA
ncbi:hypothetical protein HMPREF3159_07455 [Brachybacterium sp. HMSC06H03]|uniref:hypothetical protein n=1 Tax=Brachybacterium sp. HMSC06H03 TaxID=1581127 RepID=UPI0008A165EC|nr:hypothetical protein [Brachybacterium sp. HMSC06H03]OFT58871.1 hypothetical protein HMPREF3159_07455 [Brachybacterium sp. HMSC06H03]